MEPASDARRLAAVVPGYVLEHDSPAALFTRLQRVVIFLEKLQLEAVERFDITFNEFVILATLLKEPPPHELSVGRVAEYVLRPMGSISQAIDMVAGRGLVQRRHLASDRRKVAVSLTPEGKVLGQAVLDNYDHIRERVFARFHDDELSTVDRSVHVLLRALEDDYWHQGESDG